VRLAWIIIVLLIMVLPQTIGVAIAGDLTWANILSSRPAGLSIGSPMLIMLGCILVWLAGLCRKKFNQKPNRDHHVPGYSQQRT